jgi:hypothetical protein
MSDEKERAVKVTDGLIADAVQLRNEIDRLRKRAGYTDSEVIADLRKMLETEQAEVERLRADLKLYKEARARDIERANEAIAREDKLANDFAAAAQEINCLRAENEALETAHAETLAEVEAENAELRASVAEALKEAAVMLRDYKKLAWFERRQKLVDDLLTVYRVMTDPDNESIVEAVGRLFDFDVTDFGERQHIRGENAELKARLAWFEKREHLVREVAASADVYSQADGFYAWESEHPRPGSEST